ncbi:MAG: hypothetical protein IT521_01420 [Burkholderiales bacterium]|nr:hypothetical protein [Burkholderiales bacterium]
MPTTAYVLEPNPAERTWIRAALGGCVDTVTFLEDCTAPLACGPVAGEAVFIAAAEPDDARTLKLVQDLRSRGASLPVIVLGPHSAFRAAVGVARLDATDFLERPATERQLRAAVGRALASFQRRHG